MLLRVRCVKSLEFEGDSNAIAQGNNRREEILALVEQPVMFENSLRALVFGAALPRHLTAPEHVIDHIQSALSNLFCRQLECLGILRLIDVVEDDVELPFAFGKNLESVPDLDFHAG